MTGFCKSRLDGSVLQILTPEEREKARRFHREEDRMRSLWSKAALRILLGQYLGQAPQEVRLGCTETGKPVCYSPAGPPVIAFNLSHSGDGLIVAFRRGGDVGVDIEQRTARGNLQSVAERAFCPGDSEKLRRIRPARQLPFFYTLWVRREALSKAMGTGLFDPEAWTDLPADAEAARSARWRVVSAGRGRWGIRNVPVSKEYAAAVAVSLNTDRCPSLRSRSLSVGDLLHSASGTRTRPSAKE